MNADIQALRPSACFFSPTLGLDVECDYDDSECEPLDYQFGTLAGVLIVETVKVQGVDLSENLRDTTITLIAGELAGHLEARRAA